MDQVSYSITIAGGFLDDALHLRPVGKTQFATSGECKQFFGKGPGQGLGLASQMALEFGESGELYPILKISRCIHFRALPILHPSTLDEAIDLRMFVITEGAGSAGGHLAAATATISAFDCPDDDLTVSAVPNALVLFNPVFDNSPKGYGHDRLGDDYKKFSPIENLDGKQPPTIVFLGDRDNHLPVTSANRYERTMKAKGNLCKTCIYEGKGHGFFNLHKNGRDSFVATMTEADRFLAGLGFLQGKPHVEAWLQAEEKK